MIQARSGPARPLPRWFMILASVVVAFHLLAVVVLALGASSGPWSTTFGPTPAMGPQFATVLSQVTTDHYLRYLRMTHNYHFATNRPEWAGVFLEVKLKDGKGNVVRTVKIPDEQGNPLLQHRQLLLAQGLANDQPVQARPGEIIAAPGQKIQDIKIWDNTQGPALVIKTVPEHLIPRDRPVSRPSEWSQLMARSYMRHLLRQYGAESAELSRHSRDPIRPEWIFAEQAPPGSFTTLVSNFGEIKGEN